MKIISKKGRDGKIFCRDSNYMTKKTEGTHQKRFGLNEFSNYVSSNGEKCESLIGNSDVTNGFVRSRLLCEFELNELYCIYFATNFDLVLS